MNRSKAALAILASTWILAAPAFASDQETQPAAPAPAVEPAIPVDAEQAKPEADSQGAATEAAAAADAAATTEAGATREAAAAAEAGAAAETKAAVAENATADTEASDPIICKRFEQTGTRLRKGKVCRPASSWKKLEKTAEDIVGGIERGSSTGVGGEQFPTGT